MKVLIFNWQIISNNNWFCYVYTDSNTLFENWMKEIIIVLLNLIYLEFQFLLYLYLMKKMLHYLN